jgi:hypothetical protein
VVQSQFDVVAQYFSVKFIGGFEVVVESFVVGEVVEEGFKEQGGVVVLFDEMLVGAEEGFVFLFVLFAGAESLQKLVGGGGGVFGEGEAQAVQDVWV